MYAGRILYCEYATLPSMQPPDFGPGRASDPDPDLNFELKLHNFYWGALVIYSMYTRSNFGKIIGIFCRQGSIIEKIYFWLDRKFEAWVIREFEFEFESNRPVLLLNLVLVLLVRCHGIGYLGFLAKDTRTIF